jgi:hypothetical protein
VASSVRGSTCATSYSRALSAPFTLFWVFWLSQQKNTAKKRLLEWVLSRLQGIPGEGENTGGVKNMVAHRKNELNE